MSAARKLQDGPTPVATRAHAGLSLAGAQSQPGVNGVFDQHLRLTTAFAPSTRDESYPGAVKLAILIGAPLALWSGLFAAGSWLFHRL